MSNESPYQALLHDTCVVLGFCGSTIDGHAFHVDDFIPDSGSVSADQYVDWVFQAEGMDPAGSDALRYGPKLREAFVRHMGSQAVEAESLK